MDQLSPTPSNNRLEDTTQRQQEWVGTMHGALASDDLVLAHRRAGCGPAAAGLHVVEEDPRAGRRGDRRGDRRVDQGMRNRRPLQIFSQDEALSSTSGFA